MQRLWAQTALTPDGWRDGVRVVIDAEGRITEVAVAAPVEGDMRVDVLTPAPANLHSHAFQRAMAGMTESRSGADGDSFWTWRALMYRFLDQLTPDDVEAIAAMVQIESLEAGFAAIGEFHYLHHQPDGASYRAPAEMAERIVAAAAQTGIGLTLLPVFYARGGCDGRPLGPSQMRFGCDRDRFGALLDSSAAALRRAPADARLGVAPHSLRAVGPADLQAAVEMATRLAPDAPIHLHIAEQTAEVDEVTAAYGARPVEWLLGAADVDRRWCLIHATQMTPEETDGMAKTGAVAGLCPITEANLGDGIFDGARFDAAGGRFGVGSDSNVRISLTGELRLLEYSQRLRDRARAVLADAERSCGRVLLETAALGGAQALGRDAGRIAEGAWADLLALDGTAGALVGAEGDMLLDAFVFASEGGGIRDVWAAGRHVVRAGRHPARDAVMARYRQTLRRLKDRL